MIQPQWQAVTDSLAFWTLRPRLPVLHDKVVHGNPGQQVHAQSMYPNAQVTMLDIGHGQLVEAVDVGGVSIVGG